MNAKNAKAIAAAIGATLTALSAALTAVTFALSDDKIDITEVGALLGTLVVLIGTVRAVWQVENAKSTPSE